MKPHGLGWGVIGASWVGEDFVIPALRESGAEVAAVCSSDQARASSYAARNRIPGAYSSIT